tara:strand:- start:496 stop:729 length:234 start_codon:yes stop_codon:yes gene_type:complete
MKSLKTSKGAKKGGRPKKNNKVINVAKYMPQIRNVAKRQLIIGQLDQLKSNLDNAKVSNAELHYAIDQIKKDFLLVI